jgi:hypothetical protein
MVFKASIKWGSGNNVSLSVTLKQGLQRSELFWLSASSWHLFTIQYSHLILEEVRLDKNIMCDWHAY